MVFGRVRERERPVPWPLTCSRPSFCAARYCAAKLPVIVLPLAPKQLRAGCTRADAGHLLLRRGSLTDSLATPRSQPRPPSTASPSLDLLLILCSPSLSSPNAPGSAARRSHGHQASLTPPTSPEAPPRPPLPLHQATRPRTPCIAAHVAVPLLGHRRSSPSIRCTPAAPEPTNHPYSSAVSLRAEPLSLPSRLRALGHSSAAAELRPLLTSSPPSLQPLELPPECTIVLRTSPRARCMPQLALPCP